MCQVSSRSQQLLTSTMRSEEKVYDAELKTYPENQDCDL
jgi:hypothetical protein